jgi:hypothetical protein
MREAWELLIAGPEDADRSVLLLPGGANAARSFDLSERDSRTTVGWPIFPVVGEGSEIKRSPALNCQVLSADLMYFVLTARRSSASTPSSPILSG